MKFLNTFAILAVSVSAIRLTGEPEKTNSDGTTKAADDKADTVDHRHVDVVTNMSWIHKVDPAGKSDNKSNETVKETDEEKAAKERAEKDKKLDNESGKKNNEGGK